ncbi:transmembrane protein 200C-like [Morone saxatilis]|uniref:transmembrane protein 200C-like n=1 Tax=Morone saxatilis TaxID=34816 RepID=UPI0015E23B9C|nr:transmembrane protein 200C-like [Morone saxatilis]
MIATGGLLRINARRQDSLKSKTHKAHTHKRKTKKKRRSEVVVVKGKLKLFSVSGLVAALGILVLLVGVVMAALGYWPRDGLFFSTRPQEGATMASVSSGGSTPAPADGGGTGEDLEGDKADSKGGGRGDEGGDSGDEEGGGDDVFNRTETINGTQQLPQGFLEDFLDRYLYSDRLKVFGPLIMGIGIFLFICANAVLHENRDKKTKIINLRDIYSTVIDLHSLRKPNASSTHRSSTNPLNGLVNYVQSKSLETKPRAYPASLMNRKEGGGGGGEGGGGPLSRQPFPDSSSRAGGGGGGCDGEGGDTVFSIYQEQPNTHPPPPSSSHRLSLPPSFSPPHLSTCWISPQKDTLSTFTLPLRRPQPPAPHRRHSARARTGWGWEGGTKGQKEHKRDGGGHRQEEEEEMYTCAPPPLCSSTPPLLTALQGSSAASCSSSSVHREAPGGSQALLLSSSHLSLSSLSHLLSSSSSTPAPSCRRRSLPTSSSTTGYSKLPHREDESFESTEVTTSHHVTSQGTEVTSHRKYSNREKLRMISQVDSGLRQEEEG